MQYVNFHLIGCALAPLTIANVTSSGELNIDPEDEPRLRELFQTLVRPSVARWSARYREKLRLSLAYYLEYPEILDDVLASEQDLDMPEPKDVIRFFTILWEELFPGQDHCAVDLSNIEESNEIMEINLVRTP